MKVLQLMQLFAEVTWSAKRESHISVTMLLVSDLGISMCLAMAKRYVALRVCYLTGKLGIISTLIYFFGFNSIFSPVKLLSCK